MQQITSIIDISHLMEGSDAINSSKQYSIIALGTFGYSEGNKDRQNVLGGWARTTHFVPNLLEWEICCCLALQNNCMCYSNKSDQQLQVPLILLLKQYTVYST